MGKNQTATKGYMDDIPLAKVRAFETGLITEVRDAHKEIIKAISETKVLAEETTKKLEAAIKEFKRRFTAAATTAAPGKK